MEARLRRVLVEETPLPPCWVAVARPDGQTEYLNEITGERQSTHPAEEYIQTRLSSATGSTISDEDQGDNEVGQLILTGEPNDEKTQGVRFAQSFDTSWDSDQSKQVTLKTAAPDQNWKRVPSPDTPWRQAVDIADKTCRKAHQSSGLNKGQRGTPPTLHFTSWWAEESVANAMLWKHVDITYVVESSEFRLRFHGSSDVVSVSHVIGKYGPVTEHDLHVGATLRLLGRHMTLKQAEGPTIEWLESERKRLRSIRDRLATELSKYDLAYDRLRHLYAKQEATFNKASNTTQGGKGSMGMVPLRSYKVEVDELYNHLREIRPKLAEKLERELGGSTLR